MSPFSAPFSGALNKARASAPKASGCILGGNQRFMGGTGKAEDVKLPGAGISLKQCPGNGVENRWLTEPGRSVPCRTS
jgi:hypothetical protein